MGETAESFVTTEECAAATGRVLESHERLHSKLDSIEKRLFRDNGSVSIQTRLDRHEQVIRAMLWGVSVVGGAMLTSIVVGAIYLLRAVVERGPA